MKKCSQCGEEIPIARIKAIPNAKQCVPCLTSMGDVPTLKRYDEHGNDSEVISTFYVKSNYIEEQLRRVSSYTPPDEDEEASADYDFIKPIDHPKGYHMSEAFEKDDEG